MLNIIVNEKHGIVSLIAVKAQIDAERFAVVLRQMKAGDHPHALRKRDMLHLCRFLRLVRFVDFEPVFHRVDVPAVDMPRPIVNVLKIFFCLFEKRDVFAHLFFGRSGDNRSILDFALFGRVADQLRFGRIGHSLLFRNVFDSLLFGDIPDRLLLGRVFDNLLFGNVFNSILRWSVFNSLLFRNVLNGVLLRSVGNNLLFVDVFDSLLFRSVFDFSLLGCVADDLLFRSVDRKRFDRHIRDFVDRDTVSCHELCELTGIPDFIEIINLLIH